MKPAECIRAAREHLGLNQAQFAQLLGHHPITISRWETGIFDPDPYDVALAERLLKTRPRRHVPVLLMNHGPIYTLCRILAS